MKSPFIRSLVLVYLAALIGCDSSSDTTVVDAPPNTVVITEDNFDDIIVTVVGESLLHFNVLDFLFSDPDLPSNGACSGGGQASIQIVDSNPPGVSANDSVTRSYLECDFPNQVFEGTVDIFFDEASGDIRIDNDTGRIIFFGNSEGEFDVEVGEYEVTNLLPERTLQVDRDTVRTIDQTIDQDNEINEFIDASEGIRFAFSVDEAASRFELFELLLSVDNVDQRYSLASSKTEQTKSYKFTNTEIEGTVTVTIPPDTALEGSFLTGIPRQFLPPDAGQFVVVGKNDTSMLVTIDDSTVPVIVDVRIDITGDGEFDVFETLTWAELGLDLDFSFLR